MSSTAPVRYCDGIAFLIATISLKLSALLSVTVAAAAADRIPVGWPVPVPATIACSSALPIAVGTSLAIAVSNALRLWMPATSTPFTDWCGPGYRTAFWSR